jgi:hypothetical protein
MANPDVSIEPILIRFAREKVPSPVAFHFDDQRQINIIDGTDTPAAAGMRSLMKSQGVVEDPV